MFQCHLQLSLPCRLLVACSWSGLCLAQSRVDTRLPVYVSGTSPTLPFISYRHCLSTSFNPQDLATHLTHKTYQTLLCASVGILQSWCVVLVILVCVTRGCPGGSGGVVVVPSFNIIQTSDCARCFCYCPLPNSAWSSQARLIIVRPLLQSLSIFTIQLGAYYSSVNQCLPQFRLQPRSILVDCSCRFACRFQPACGIELN